MRLRHVHAMRANLAVVAWGLIAASSAIAAPGLPAQDFPLAQSERSGAICRAVRDYGDPAAQLPGAKAWAIRCRGWEVDLGHLYSFERDGARATGVGGPWRTELGKRADCNAFGDTGEAGLSGVTRADCRSVPGGASYQVYQSSRGNSVALAEGFTPLSDVIASGLRVITGVEAPSTGSGQLRGPG